MEGSRFGRYQLVELLGRGRMGEVWRAYDSVIDRAVALKMLHAHFAEDQPFLERFRQDTRTAAGLDEPHVIPIHDFGETDGRPFVAMRLVRGRSLRSLLDDGPLEPARAVGIIEQIARALDAAHAAGLVHGEVNASNILVGAEDFCYLTDFGLARAAATLRLTRAGAAVGGPPSVTAAAGQSGTADARADIRDLTGVLHQSLTGESPFAAGSHELIADAQSLLPLLHELDDVIATGLSRNPDSRFATGAALAAAARNAIRMSIHQAQALPAPAAAGAGHARAAVDATTPPRPAAPPHESAEARRRHVPLVIGAVVLAAVALVAAVTVATVKSQHHSAARAQSTLPFIGVRPHDVQVDSNGTVYIADDYANEVLSLPAGSTNPTTLPFIGLHDAYGVAVDSKGTVYVADSGNHRVVSLAAGSTNQTVVPFTGLHDPNDLAIDSNGTVYVTDNDTNQVLSLTAGSTEQTVLPFVNLQTPMGVAVDGKGTVYVADYGTGEVLSLAAGSTEQSVVPVSGVDGVARPYDLSVHSDGTLYVVGNERDRVLALAPGATSPTILPFTDLNSPSDIAVDNNGTVYVADYANNRVVSLTPG